MSQFYCAVCRESSGASLVCEACRTELTAYQQKQVTILWHDAVRERARTNFCDAQGEELYRCYHCENLFPKDECCGDHYPDTKAAAAKSRYDVNAGVCACARCNTSGNNNRKAIKKDLCKKCRIRLPVYDGVCVTCR